jgi:hypothetical protein
MGQGLQPTVKPDTSEIERGNWIFAGVDVDVAVDSEGRRVARTTVWHACERRAIAPSAVRRR